MWPFSAKRDPSDQQLPSGWLALTTIEDFRALARDVSNDELWAIFKHSYRCSISHAAYSRMEAWNSIHPEAPVYLVDVVLHRPLSQEIALWSGVPHESPQVIVFKGKEVLAAASHFDVRPGMFKG